MFKNIGKKIMVLTTVLCIIGMVLSLLAGFSVFYVLGDKTNNIAIAVLAGIVVAVLYAFICWISSFTAYGYGKLIDNTDKLVKAVEQLTAKTEEKPVAEAAVVKEHSVSEPTVIEEQPAKSNWTCEKCGASVSPELDECPICKIMEKPEDKE